MNQESLELYRKALEAVPALHQNKKGKLKRGGILGSIQKPKASVSIKKMKEEIAKKDAEIESLHLSQHLDQTHVQPIQGFGSSV